MYLLKFRKTRKQRESKQTPEVVSPSQVPLQLFNSQVLQILNL